MVLGFLGGMGRGLLFGSFEMGVQLGSLNADPISDKYVVFRYLFSYLTHTNFQTWFLARIHTRFQTIMVKSEFQNQMAPKPMPFGFGAAHTYITYMWQYHPPPSPGGFTHASFSANLSNKVRKLGLAIHWYNTNWNKIIHLTTSFRRSQGLSHFLKKGKNGDDRTRLFTPVLAASAGYLQTASPHFKKGKGGGSFGALQFMPWRYGAWSPMEPGQKC